VEYRGEFEDPDFGDYRLKGRSDDAFRTIGLTAEPRFSVPVNATCDLERFGQDGLRLTVRNGSANAVTASMRLYDDFNCPLSSPDERFEFSLAPREHACHDFHDCAFGSAAFVEARSPTSGVRPARVYLR
jgi:hypothetical protein